MLIKPTERQASIISDANFPRYLTAGPGTGKTEVLINKIIHLIELEPDMNIAHFAIITYTNKATDEMRSRLSDRIYDEYLQGAKNRDDKKRAKWQYLLDADDILEISTIHSFCYGLLRKYGTPIGHSTDLRIKSYKQELNDIVDVVLSRTDEHLLGRIPGYRLRHIIRDVLKECYNHGITPDMDFIKHNRADDRLWAVLEADVLHICIEVHEELERKKQELNALTLNDLISKAVKLLRDAQVAERVAREYKYLFIDEFQDTNRSQLDIVRILIGAGVKVFLIGDEKQSIYAFRGADIECSRQARELMGEYHDADNFQINENFRTDQELLVKINEVFNEAFMFKGRELSFPRATISKTAELQSLPQGNGNPFRITYGVEVPDIIKSLSKEQMHGRRINYDDIFILCRTNYEVRQISGKLRRSGIPSSSIGGQGFFTSKEITDTYKLFSAVFYRKAAHLRELISTDYYQAMVRSGKEQLFRTFFVELISVFKEKTIDEILEHIYQSSGIIEYYYSRGDKPSVDNLFRLKTLAADMYLNEYAQPLDFTEYLKEMIESGADEYASCSEGTVSVLTIHKAKGLSLPIVIIPNIDRNLIRKRSEPDYVIDRNDKVFALGNVLGRIMPSQKYSRLLKEKTFLRLEEEIRVLYVAMTRVKHILIMTNRGSKEELAKSTKNKDEISWSAWVK